MCVGGQDVAITDCFFLAESPSPTCEETCIYSANRECDDGGPNSVSSLCAYGTDCNDCGARMYDPSGIHHIRNNDL